MQEHSLVSGPRLVYTSFIDLHGSLTAIRTRFTINLLNLGPVLLNLGPVEPYLLNLGPVLLSFRTRF